MQEEDAAQTQSESQRPLSGTTTCKRKKYTLDLMLLINVTNSLYTFYRFNQKILTKFL